MRLLGVAALCAAGCLSAPSSGERDAGVGGGDGDPGECEGVELPDFAPAPAAWSGNVLDLEFDDVSDHVFHDHSGNRRDAAIRAIPRDSGPDVDHGQSIVLEGADDITMPDHEAFDLETFTIEMWIRRGDQGPVNAALMSDYDGGAVTWELGLNASKQPTFRTSLWSMALLNAVAPDVWVQLAVTRDEDGIVCFYVDASSKSCGELDAPIPPDEPQPWTIGRRPEGTNPFIGHIDAVRISDHARGAAELAESSAAGGIEPRCGDLVIEGDEACEPNAPCCNEMCDEENACGDAGCSEGVCDLAACAEAPTRGRLVLYTLDEGSGMIANDSASPGDPIDLELSDGAAFTEDGLELDGGEAVPSGDAARLIDAITDSSELTIDAWLTTETTESPVAFLPIISLSPGDSTAAVLGLNTNGSAAYAARIASTYTSDGQPDVEGPTGQVETAKRTHVVVTRTAAGLRSLYVDGRLRSANQVDGALDWAGGTLHLGAPGADDERWTGVLHRIAIHSVALDAAEVAASYWAGRQ